MYEGKIIKFYREKYQITQEQLGKGICSGTHISKIERLQTEYAPEIVALLSQRLGINLEHEMKNLKNIKMRLNHWHNVIIMQLFEEMDTIHEELEHLELIKVSEYVNLYNLLQARYLLMKNRTDEALILIKVIQKIEHKLTPYDSNLLKHVLGIYYLANQDYLNAIQPLKAIQDEVYNNPEYYYHLAVAYHSIESPIMAYFYADKSRQFFKGINNYIRVIDAEMIMTIQLKDDGDFTETIKRFENLIQGCELCNAPHRKAKVLHNLAYEYYRRKKFEPASRYYKDSLSLKDKESSPYLLSLEGYIRSSFLGCLLPPDELLQLAKEGLETAIQKNDLLYINLFNLICYLLQFKEHEYYEYLYDRALPMFKKFGFVYLIHRSKKELFNYYSKTNQTSKALKIAEVLINH
ncbi:helix-turn-helix domain-containing protein [Paenisporosarcina sp.]|uniref:helix-turn-helix domain-containing protein n=1 Tax=Paenisporosarcina sp. TaxID=1932001 RepID=UPI003C70732F